MRRGHQGLIVPDTPERVDTRKGQALAHRVETSDEAAPAWVVRMLGRVPDPGSGPWYVRGLIGTALGWTLAVRARYTSYSLDWGSSAEFIFFTVTTDSSSMLSRILSPLPSFGETKGLTFRLLSPAPRPPVIFQ